MSVLSKQEWLSTAKEFKALNMHVFDTKFMIEHFCGKKKKTAIDKHHELYYLCDDYISSLLDKVLYSQYFDENHNAKYPQSDIPRVLRDCGETSIYIFYNTELPENFEQYDKGMESKRPRPLLNHIPASYSSIYLDNLEQLNTLVHKVLGEDSYYRIKMSPYDIQLFNKFNDLVQKCIKLIKDMTM